MGYRSDVYMCIKGPTKSILAGIATLRLEGDTAMHEALDEWNVTACSETHATMVGTDGELLGQFRGGGCAHGNVWRRGGELKNEKNE